MWGYLWDGLNRLSFERIDFREINIHENSRITTDSPNIFYSKKKKKKKTVLSDFYCFTINNRYVTQLWYNTVLDCHMIKCCAYIALIIAFASSKRDVVNRRFNKYVMLFSNHIFNIWKKQLAERFKKFIRQN